MYSVQLLAASWCHGKKGRSREEVFAQVAPAWKVREAPWPALTLRGDGRVARAAFREGEPQQGARRGPGGVARER